MADSRLHKAVAKTCPQTRQEVIQCYFMEHRAKLIDIAAYLDRIDRSSGPEESDFRDIAFRHALKILCEAGPHRVRRILELLSDRTVELPQSAAGMKGASGAVRLDEGSAP